MKSLRYLIFTSGAILMLSLFAFGQQDDKKNPPPPKDPPVIRVEPKNDPPPRPTPPPSGDKGKKPRSFFED